MTRHIQHRLDAKFCGRRLREYRIRMGITQWDVANALGYTSAQFISNWERGVSYPPDNASVVLGQIYEEHPQVIVNLLYDCRAAELEQKRQGLLASLPQKKLKKKQA